MSTAAKFLIQYIKRMEVSMESYLIFSALLSSTESLALCHYFYKCFYQKL